MNPVSDRQPIERGMRYANMRSAMAEEGVIRLLMQDDSLFPDQPPLREDEFSSPLLGRIYGELWRCRGSGSSMAALSARASNFFFMFMISFSLLRMFFFQNSEHLFLSSAILSLSLATSKSRILSSPR